MMVSRNNQATSSNPPTVQTLRDRLAGLQGATSNRTATTAPPGPPAYRPAVTIAGGYEVTTPFGPTYVVEQRYPLDHQHGPHQLGALHQFHPELLALLSGQSAAFTPTELVLLDTETTGLAGGTGTHVFLVGLGFFEQAPAQPPGFVVQQYFLRDLREERAFLYALAATLSRFQAMVSFNGKSFDWPLLTTRFVLTRSQLQPHLHQWPHLDLLHPARRIWKHRLGSCSLTALEAGVLGIERVDDLPGALIPERYFRYLRDGDIRPLLPILSHNATDIVSLLTLLIHLGQLLTNQHQGIQAGSDLYGLATLQAALGQEQASLATLRAALADRALPAPLRRATRYTLARALKRDQQWAEAVPLWREAIKAEARRKTPDLWAYVELAKYFEHVVRDYPAAIATIEAATQLRALRTNAIWNDDFGYRLTRLQRKAAGHQGRSTEFSLY